jgi:oligosaccharide 4-alpha-D-glucosyltransferase
MLRKTVVVLALFLIVVLTKGQAVKIIPADPSANDTVTLFYNAELGNGALKDYAGDVYLHTGVITAKSLDNHDWKNVVGNWGKPDKHVLMKREDKNIYSYRFVINNLYNLQSGTKVHQLTFVFRNADGSLVGKDKNNNDF